MRWRARTPLTSDLFRYRCSISISSTERITIDDAVLQKANWAKIVMVATACATSAHAHDIITTNLTYTRDISGILMRRCLACHGTGDSIPLTKYDEVRPWAVDIKEQVLSRAMPPWGAVKGFGDLEPDHALSQEEIMIISAWVIGGAPNGNPALAPRPQQKISVPRDPNFRDLQTVATRTTLESPISLLGIRPLPAKTVNSSRVIARLPDGRIQPLVWLYQYSAKSTHVFFFRKPVALPAGTLIESSEPLRFTLEGPAA